MIINFEDEKKKQDKLKEEQMKKDFENWMNEILEKKIDWE